MAQVVWTRRALIKLELVRSYISEFDPEAAERLAARLIEAGNSLREFPERGRPSTRGRRELPTIPPYVIRYKIEGAGRHQRHQARARAARLSAFFLYPAPWRR